MARFEGRLFAVDGRLCMVVEADEASGVGRVSLRVQGRQQVVEMPLAEIARRISSGGGLLLDNTSGAEASRRVTRRKDGWFFSTREGPKGPYRSSKEAERDLGRHILATQSA